MRSMSNLYCISQYFFFTFKIKSKGRDRPGDQAEGLCLDVQGMAGASIGMLFSQGGQVLDTAHEHV